MSDRCKNCKYFHRLKYDFIPEIGFAESYACDVMLHVEDSKDGWIQEVVPDDMCEMFEVKDEVR